MPAVVRGTSGFCRVSKLAPEEPNEIKKERELPGSCSPSNSAPLGPVSKQKVKRREQESD